MGWWGTGDFRPADVLGRPTCRPTCIDTTTIDLQYAGPIAKLKSNMMEYDTVHDGVLVDTWRRKEAELREEETGWSAPTMLNTVLPGTHTIRNSSHLGNFTYWTFAGIIILKPQLLLGFPDLRVRHQGSIYHYNPIKGRLELDDVRKP